MDILIYIPCNHLTWVAGPYPFSFLAAIRNMMAGFVEESTCAAVREFCGTTHVFAFPQYTRTNANWDFGASWKVPVLNLVKLCIIAWSTLYAQIQLKKYFKQRKTVNDSQVKQHSIWFATWIFVLVYSNVTHHITWTINWLYCYL